MSRTGAGAIGGSVGQRRRSWTFARSLTMGFGVVLTLTLVIAGIALVGLRVVVQKKDRVIDRDAQSVLGTQKLLTIMDARAAANRGYLISGNASYLKDQYDNDAAFDQEVAAIRQELDTATGWTLLDRVVTLQHQFVVLDRRPVELHQAGASATAVTAAWESIDPEREATEQAMNRLQTYQQDVVASRARAASAAATLDVRVIVALTAVVILLAAGFAVGLVRRLRSRVSTVVRDVKESSTDLERTAAGLADGASQQAVTAGRMSSSTSQLLTSSREIAAGAQQVSEAADRTVQTADTGGDRVRAAHAAMGDARTQVDVMVGHMLEMGRTSQRIGTILEIMSDIAEQTDILAINSMIEAADAGESGRRFAVVADEIRRLADRTAVSTKEVRALVESVQKAVTEAVSATQLGSTAVEHGQVEVDQAVLAFEDIVLTAREATDTAREIQASTQQQAAAVEQLSYAAVSLATASRGTHADSGRTVETAAQLRRLSDQLQALAVAGRDQSNSSSSATIASAAAGTASGR